MKKNSSPLFLYQSTTSVVIAPIYLVLILLMAVSLFWAVDSFAQPEIPTDLPRLESPVRIDGVVNEPAWRQIQPFALTMFDPENGTAPTEGSEIRAAYDRQNLFLSARFFDSNPAGIHSNTLYRDSWKGDDTLEIILDSFFDHQTAVHFWVTPSGARGDETIANDAVGDNIYNVSWNTFWDAATHRDSDGWSVEVRIPFSSLRFRQHDGIVTMGLTVFRFIARKNETDIFPARPRKWEIAMMKPSLTHPIRLHDVEAKTPLYFAPYALGGMNQAAQPNLDGTGFQTAKNVNHDLGADLKYTISSGLTLDLTTNTDFAQVEADDQQINLSPFAIFLPEKRLFFQERSSLFDFATGRDGRLFYSRRIGLTDDGQPVRIYGGGRLIGKMGDWDLGLMELQTGGGESTGSQNTGIFRVRHRVFNDSSYTGGMVTTLLNARGDYNLNYGIDNRFKFFNSDYLTVNLAQTIDNVHAPHASLSSGMLRAQWDRSTQIGWSYRGGYTYNGKDFLPDLGFLERNDFSLIDTRLGYGWAPADSGVQYHQLSIRPVAFLRNADRSIESFNLSGLFATSMKSGYYFELFPNLQYESLLQRFDLSSNAHVPPGNYAFPGFDFYLNMPGAGRYGSEFETFLGRYYDGNRLMLKVLPRLYVSSHFDVSAEYELNSIHFASRKEKFLGQLLRLRINTAATTRLSLSGFVQYNTAEKKAAVNLRFRYNPVEGTDLYIVYNEALNTDRLSFDPQPPLTGSRSLTFKYVRTFEF